MFERKYTVICGDIKDVIDNLEEVHCVITSPPYYQQRTYGNSHHEIGKETNINNYIENLCNIFNRIHLHSLGSLWVNMGDKRNNRGGLYNIPDKFVLKMTEEYHWLLVDKVIWAKIYDNNDGTTEGNCMIEPAHGRLNSNGYEFLFRFVKCDKAQDAWSDTCAVRIPRDNIKSERYLPSSLMEVKTDIEGRNLHNVWRLPMGQTKDKHFATYPTSLIERPIAMTCPVLVNPDNSLPTRIVEMTEYNEKRSKKRIFGKYNSSKYFDNINEISGRQDIGKEYIAKKPITKGWTYILPNATPGIVFDPFMGSGTTGVVSLKLGKNFIGVDLYEENCEITNTKLLDTCDFLDIYDLNPIKEILKGEYEENIL